MGLPLTVPDTGHPTITIMKFLEIDFYYNVIKTALLDYNINENKNITL